MSLATDGNLSMTDVAQARGSLAGRVARHLALFLGVMLVWEFASTYEFVDPLILPRPTAIAASLVNMVLYQGTVWFHLGVTLWEAVAGFVIGSVIGIGLAVAAGLNDSFRRYISPYIIALQVTPRIALAPIVIAWLGFGMMPKIAIGALICFFPPFINTLTGLLNVDEDANEMFRSLGAKKRQIFFSLMLPNAMPIIMAGLKTAISLALIGAIVGEFISASEGMGVLMQRYTFALNMASSFAVLVILTVMGYALFVLMEWADNWLVYWRHDARMTAMSRKKAKAWAGLLGRRQA
ncbi:ABC transporter permease [Ancylobacter defluvii]|uniref:ABC transporter permease n=1 Tax=Ancylobacter defluvii TaxID=1282440 RepID=A0A9W6JVP1_9HYPH|nr:ABC transporter permease [Ancylobacter defluvii]MBS7589153.1 ABC transporter permease [Ancylobacter defluvii]GLK84765.1 ABC transporter permease [Ancylobacter defluvii]